MALSSFILLFIFFTLAAPNFLSALSIGNVLTFGSITGIVTIGVAMLMVSGEFDLSVGSTFALASYIMALTMIAHWPLWLSIFLSLAISVLLGLINGLIVVKAKIPSFIATLGTMLAYRGIVRAVGHGDFATFKEKAPALFNLLNGPFPLLNNLFHTNDSYRMSLIWFILLAVLFSFILMRTRYGNWTYAAGGAPEAAAAQGVNVGRVKIANFMLTGLLVAVASILQFSYRLSVDPLRGNGMELIVVAAAVIGGVRLTGGWGTIFGAVMGTLLLQILDQGLVLMHIPIQVFQATAGVIIVLSVIINIYISNTE